MDRGPVIPPNAGQQHWVLIANAGCLLRCSAAPADKPAATTIVRERRSDARAIGLKPHKSVKDNYGPGSVVCLAELKARADQGTKGDSARKRSAVLA